MHVSCAFQRIRLDYRCFRVCSARRCSPRRKTRLGIFTSATGEPVQISKSIYVEQGLTSSSLLRKIPFALS